MLRLPKWPLVATIVVTIVGLDQLTKEWATNRLSGGRTIEILPTLEFDLAYNSGFSFSTGSGNGTVVGLLVIVICGFIAWQITKESNVTRAALFATILGGALGNVADRLFRADDGFLTGEVVDFIDVSWYAVFNVADSFVVCGCIAFIVHELRQRRRDEAASTHDDARPAADAGAPSEDVAP